MLRRRVTRWVTMGLAAALAAALGAAPVVASDPTMTFGRSSLGTGCSPAIECFDDASFQAVDKIQPGAISVTAGTTVRFPVDGFHQVAIYEAGTTRDEIQPAGFLVDDPVGRVHLGPSPFGGDASTTFTFQTPGKYLIICNITPHFQFTSMWGYARVR